MFWAGHNFLCKTKNSFTYCGSHKRFVPNKKMICIQQNVFFAVTKVFNEAVNFFGWLKKIGPAQNILGPVKGQGTSITSYGTRTQKKITRNECDLPFSEFNSS